MEQELTQAAHAGDIGARKAHFDLAVLHLAAEEGTNDTRAARETLTAALFTRMAFAPGRD